MSLFFIFNIKYRQIFVCVQIGFSKFYDLEIRILGTDKIVQIVITIRKVKPACSVILFVLHNGFKSLSSLFKLFKVYIAKTE